MGSRTTVISVVVCHNALPLYFGLDDVWLTAKQRELPQTCHSLTVYIWDYSEYIYVFLLPNVVTIAGLRAWLHYRFTCEFKVRSELTVQQVHGDIDNAVAAVRFRYQCAASVRRAPIRVLAVRTLLLALFFKHAGNENESRYIQHIWVEPIIN